MILIDTHIWIWWVNGSKDLPDAYLRGIEDSRIDGIGVSAISCWEVAMLVEKGRVVLSEPIENWVRGALNQAGVILIPLLPEIAIESTRLPGTFQKDPADRIIVATARVQELPLMTRDSEILLYPHVILWTSNRP